MSIQIWIKGTFDIYLSPILIPSILFIITQAKSSSNESASPIYTLAATGSIVSTLTLITLISINALWTGSRNAQTILYSFVLITSSYMGYFVFLILKSDLNFPQIRRNFQKDVLTLGTSTEQSIRLMVLPTLIVWLQVIICIMAFFTFYRYRMRKFYIGESFILSQCLSLLFLLWTAANFLSGNGHYKENFDFQVEKTTHLLLDSGAITAMTLMSLKLSEKIVSTRAPRQLLAHFIIANALALVYWRVGNLLDKSPEKWLVQYIFATHQRLSLFSLWLSTVAGCIAFSIAWSKNATGTDSIIRKVFHAVICMIFITGYNGDMGFTSFAAGAALLVFILLETFRALRLGPIGQYLEKVCRTLRSGNDNSNLTINHIYLLIGLFLPVWILPTSSSKLSISSGLIAVGVGDTFAAIIGSLFGHHKIVATNKTFEGFVGGFLTQIIFKLWWIGFETVNKDLKFLLASTMVSIAELFILYDNLALSLVMTLLTTLMCL